MAQHSCQRTTLVMCGRRMGYIADGAGGDKACRAGHRKSMATTPRLACMAYLKARRRHAQASRSTASMLLKHAKFLFYPTRD